MPRNDQRTQLPDNADDASKCSDPALRADECWQRPFVNGVREDILTLNISLKTWSLFRNDPDWIPILTRDDAYAPFSAVNCHNTFRDFYDSGNRTNIAPNACGADTRRRADFAARLDADVFLSIHTNAREPGSLALYNNNSGTETSVEADLAQELVDQLVAVGFRRNDIRSDESNVLECHPSSFGDDSTTSRGACPHPAILIEVAAHGNAADAALLAQEAVRQQAAEALFDAVNTFKNQLE